MIVAGLKICTKCKTQKQNSNFHKNKNRPDGYFEWCKSCNNGNRQKVYLTKEKGSSAYNERKLRQKIESNIRNRDRWDARKLAGRFKDKIKKSACENCGSPDNLHMHHHDYNKPLDVITLCRTCHDVIHAPKPETGDEI